MMYGCPILVLLDKHVRLFYQTFHREPSEGGGGNG